MRIPEYGLGSAGSGYCLVVGCFRLAGAVNVREFLDQMSDYNVKKLLAPSSYLFSSLLTTNAQHADPCSGAEITMKICPSPIIMDFTSSEKHDLNSWHNTTKKPTPDSLAN
jgi:hypothetical protein